MMSDSPVSPEVVADDGECCTLWMGDIQADWDEEFLRSLFSEPAEVVSVKLMRDKSTGRPLGYAFINFSDRDSAQAALQKYNGTPIEGTTVEYRLNWGGGRRKEDQEMSVFVGDLSPEVDDEVLLDTFVNFFSSVRGAKVVYDKTNGLSKGFGFVRFGDKEEASKAIVNMNGSLCAGQPMRVSSATLRKYSSGKTNRGGYKYGGSDRYNTTVFVGGLDPEITEEQLQAHFSDCGEVVYVKIPVGRGCGFVHFSDHNHAQNAINTMTGTKLGNGRIRLAWGKSSSQRGHRNPAMRDGYFYSGLNTVGFPPFTQGMFPDPYSQYSNMYSYGYANGYLVVPSFDYNTAFPGEMPATFAVSSFAANDPANTDNATEEQSLSTPMSPTFDQMNKDIMNAASHLSESTEGVGGDYIELQPPLVAEIPHNTDQVERAGRSNTARSADGLAEEECCLTEREENIDPRKPPNRPNGPERTARDSAFARQPQHQKQFKSGKSTAHKFRNDQSGTSNRTFGNAPPNKKSGKSSYTFGAKSNKTAWGPTKAYMPKTREIVTGQ